MTNYMGKRRLEKILFNYISARTDIVKEIHSDIKKFGNKYVLKYLKSEGSEWLICCRRGYKFTISANDDEFKIFADGSASKIVRIDEQELLNNGKKSCLAEIVMQYDNNFKPIQISRVWLSEKVKRSAAQKKGRFFSPNEKKTSSLIKKGNKMYKTYYGYGLDELVKNLQFVPYRLKRNANYEVGKTYWCSYWQKWYKVLEINGTNVKISWQDGKIVTHCTSLDSGRDYELKSFESFDNMGTENTEEFRSKYNPVNNGKSLSAAEIKALCCANVIDEFTAGDLNTEYFDSREYKPNDYVYYFVWKKRNYRGFTVTKLERDLDKSPRRLNGDRL